MRRPAAVDRIFEETARRHGVTVAELQAGGSHKPFPDVRAEIAFRLKTELPREPSLPEIGRYLRCHHTSVLAMLRRSGRVMRRMPLSAHGALRELPVKDAPLARLFDPNEPDLSGEWAI